MSDEPDEDQYGEYSYDDAVDEGVAEIDAATGADVGFGADHFMASYAFSQHHRGCASTLF